VDAVLQLFLCTEQEGGSIFRLSFNSLVVRDGMVQPQLYIKFLLQIFACWLIGRATVSGCRSTWGPEIYDKLWGARASGVLSSAPSISPIEGILPAERC
jgi:hypothetical protein